MTIETIGIPHPGAMGISVAASALQSGHQVCYAFRGAMMLPGPAHPSIICVTWARWPSLRKTCSILISVCPPHAAEQVAQQVIGPGFKGLYLEANAISPQRRPVSAGMLPAGMAFADGGIIGGPAWQAGQTCLYLGGPGDDASGDLF